jgi:broad specificity polyphosphatase/5'/3'-nucleotidase SurE
MPDTEKKHKHWYQTLWGKITSGIAIAGAIWGILEGVYYFTEQWHEIQTMKKEWAEMKEEEQWVKENVNKLVKYVQDKKKSYAVGFRMFRYEDEQTGETKWKKRYRDWNGEWHDIFYDQEASELMGVDYYYYVDETKPPPDNQVYCW